ncbi:MAG: DUF1203 domain-containing protein [Pseudooceanicola nanhaiensis]|uniref:DUF1203 domain-containing protein n=1 Tax=Pseudooceanicola nanhaiensis TaxID=375761 RepID=UPI0040591937
MTFQIHALDDTPFRPYYDLTDEDLAARGARRVVAEAHPGYPCRVSLAEAEVGERLILLHHEYQPALSPYRGSHAIFVREHAEQAHPAPGEVPFSLTSRLLSVRAFDADDMMIDAEVLEGEGLSALLETWFERAEVAYVHMHNARRGCYAARATRAG